MPKGLQNDWPGNVRELINVVERAVLLCDENEITLDALPPGLGGSSTGEPDNPHQDGLSNSLLPGNWQDLPWSMLRRMVLNGLEREYLIKHLSTTRGRVGETARRAKLSTRSLHLMMKRQGLKKEAWRRQRTR